MQTKRKTPCASNTSVGLDAYGRPGVTQPSATLSITEVCADGSERSLRTALDSTGIASMHMDTEVPLGGSVFEFGLGSRMQLGLPGFLRLGLKRPVRSEGTQYTSFGYKVRAAAFYVDENENRRSGLALGTKTPPWVLAAGGDISWSGRQSRKSLSISADYSLGLNLFARLPVGEANRAYRERFKQGHNTVLPMDTASGIGGVFARGVSALHIFNLSVGHEFDLEVADPTIAPWVRRNRFFARMKSRGGAQDAARENGWRLSYDAGLALGLRPGRERGSEMVPSARVGLGVDRGSQSFWALKAQGEVSTRNWQASGSAVFALTGLTPAFAGAQIFASVGAGTSRYSLSGPVVRAQVGLQWQQGTAPYREAPSIQYRPPAKKEARVLSTSIAQATYLDPRKVKELSFAQLVNRVRELGDNAVNDVLSMLGRGAAGQFDYAFHADDVSKYSPEEFWEKRQGVCAEYNIFAARMLNEAGIEAYPMEYFAGGLAHVATAYKDPSTERWSIADYDLKIRTDADSPEEAVAQYEPDFMRIIRLGPNGGLPSIRRVVLSVRTRFMRDYFENPKRAQ